MALEKDEPIFRQYVKHVLKWEGRTSKDPDDTAASCAPSKGAIHTNKGVTFCTFKEYAAKLGISPVTHARFLNLTDDDIAKFVYHFCEAAKASQLADRVALSVTEAAWGSGPYRAVVHLQEALAALGLKVSVDGKAGVQTIGAANSFPEDVLFDAYWVKRRAFLKKLTDQKKYAKWKKGWDNRVNDFMGLFG